MIQSSYCSGMAQGDLKKWIVSSVEANHIFYITRPKAGCTCCSDTGATRQHGHFPVTWCATRSPGAQALLDCLLPLLPLQRALSQSGFGSLSLSLAPFPFLYAVTAAESSAWKQHFTPDYQPLEMTQDLHVASLQIFFLACLDLEVSEGTRSPRSVPSYPCFLLGQLQRSLTMGHPLKPPLTSGISRPVQACSAPGFVAFSRAFLQGSRRRDELCPSLILFVRTV